MTDLSSGVLTREMIEDLKTSIEEESSRLYRDIKREGPRVNLYAWEWRGLGFNLSADIPDNAMVSLAERGPMRVRE